MFEVRSLTGADNFIAVVNHLPKDKLGFTEERHIYNLKYIEKLKIMVRLDEMSDWCQSLGLHNQGWLKTARNIKIYCSYLADTTKAW